MAVVVAVLQIILMKNLKQISCQLTVLCFFELFFVKKYLLVGASSMLWTGQWMSESVSQ